MYICAVYSCVCMYMNIVQSIAVWDIFTYVYAPGSIYLFIQSIYVCIYTDISPYIFEYICIPSLTAISATFL